jgi:hypothetical protein
MQINVGFLTGSTPKFLLLHLEPITRKNWPQTYVTQTLGGFKVKLQEIRSSRRSWTQEFFPPPKKDLRKSDFERPFVLLQPQQL